MTDDAPLPDPHLPDGMPLSGGQYVLGGFMAAGGFGLTYRASDRFGRDVVVKECFPQGLSQRADGTRVTALTQSDAVTFRKCIQLFLREARALAKLRHPNIVEVQTVFEENGTAYMVMEYVEGRTLQHLIDDAPGGMDPARVTAMATQLLDAMGAVHEAGMLHRDVKPANLLIDHAGRAVLIDFGAAKLAARDQTRGASSLAVVSDGYSPNEFYVAGVPHGPESDLYAVAATLYAAVTGRAPASAPIRNEAVNNHRADPVQPLAGTRDGYAPGFLQAIDQSLSLTRRDRLQSVADWRARIAPVAVPDKPPQRRVAPFLLSALGGAALGAGAMTLWEGNDTWLSGGGAGPVAPDARVAELQAQLDRAQDRATQADLARSTLQAQLQAAQAETPAQIADLQDRLTRLQTDLSDARAQAALLRQQADQARRDADAARADLSAREADLNRALAQAATRERTAQQTIADLRRELDNLRAQAASTDADALRDRIAALQQARDAALARADTLQERLRQAEQVETGLRRQLAQARAETGGDSTLRAQLDAARKRESDLRRDLIALQTSINGLRSRLQALDQ